MANIDLSEKFSLFKNTINLLGQNLLTLSNEMIEYNIFEEFDSDSASFLSELILKELVNENLISEEIFNMASKLRDDFRKLENSSLWNMESVKNSIEWKNIFKLADQIKIELKNVKI